MATTKEYEEAMSLVSSLPDSDHLLLRRNLLQVRDGSAFLRNKSVQDKAPVDALKS